MHSYLRVLHSLSIKMLSVTLPLPSIEMATPASLSTEVNWVPSVPIARSQPSARKPASKGPWEGRDHAYLPANPCRYDGEIST